MPDDIGAFLKASRCFSALGVNITRVSYNKAIDTHTLFIDAEGGEEQLKQADEELKKIGYIQSVKESTAVVLIEFQLKDEPGSVTEILSLINDYKFNISYISSQENGTDYQYFKMGLYVDDEEKIARFLKDVEKKCKVRVIDYNSSEKFYDNTIFYDTYVQGLAETVGLNETDQEKLLVQVNLAMQTLDETGLSPYRTFDSIAKCAEMLSQYKGDRFNPRITTHKVGKESEIIVVEPPCGSNTIIIKSRGEVLFVDSGYACFREEMLKVFRSIVPDFDAIKKRLLLTHADVDHCGLAYTFDEVIASAKSARSLSREWLGEGGIREENAYHKPYVNICKLLTLYTPTPPDKLKVLWAEVELIAPLTQIGFLDVGELHFEVYEGAGGHLPGEIVLLDYENHVAFTGDVYINLHGQIKPQAEYNQYAPILMTTVDTDPNKCKIEREGILQRLGVGEWKIFGSHGCAKEYGVKID